MFSKKTPIIKLIRNIVIFLTIPVLLKGDELSCSSISYSSNYSFNKTNPIGPNNQKPMVLNLSSSESRIS